MLNAGGGREVPDNSPDVQGDRLTISVDVHNR